MLSPFPLHIHSPPTIEPNIPCVLFPRPPWRPLGADFPPSIMGARQQHLESTNVFLCTHRYLLHYDAPPRPHTRPRTLTLTTPLYAITLHTSHHKLSIFTCLPKNVPFRAVLTTLMEFHVEGKDFTPECKSPHALAKYTKDSEPWLYSPPLLTKERSSMGRAATGTAQVGVLLVSLFDSLFKQLRLHCLDVSLTWYLWHIKVWWQYLYW